MDRKEDEPLGFLPMSRDSSPPQARAGVFFCVLCTAILRNPLEQRGLFMAAKRREDFARYDGVSIAPIGARTVTAEAGNNFCAFLWQKLHRNGFGLRLPALSLFVATNCPRSPVRRAAIQNSITKTQERKNKVGDRGQIPSQSEVRWTPLVRQAIGENML